MPRNAPYAPGLVHEALPGAGSFITNSITCLSLMYLSWLFKVPYYLVRSTLDLSLSWSRSRTVSTVDRR